MSCRLPSWARPASGCATRCCVISSGAIWSEVVDVIISQAKKALAETSGNKDALKALFKEALDTLGIEKGRVYVAAKDISEMKELVDKDKEWSKRIVEVKECDCTGGVIVEDIDGKLRIDNTYETRLEMLLPNLMPEIGKELFGERS